MSKIFETFNFIQESLLCCFIWAVKSVFCLFVFEVYVSQCQNSGKLLYINSYFMHLKLLLINKVNYCLISYGTNLLYKILWFSNFRSSYKDSCCDRLSTLAKCKAYVNQISFSNGKTELLWCCFSLIYSYIYIFLFSQLNNNYYFFLHSYYFISFCAQVTCLVVLEFFFLHSILQSKCNKITIFLGVFQIFGLEV